MDEITRDKSAMFNANSDRSFERCCVLTVTQTRPPSGNFEGRGTAGLQTAVFGGSFTRRHSPSKVRKRNLTEDVDRLRHKPVEMGQMPLRTCIASPSKIFRDDERGFNEGGVADPAILDPASFRIGARHEFTNPFLELRWRLAVGSRYPQLTRVRLLPGTNHERESGGNVELALQRVMAEQVLRLVGELFRLVDIKWAVGAEFVELSPAAVREANGLEPLGPLACSGRKRVSRVCA